MGFFSDDDERWKRGKELRDSGFDGPIDQDGNGHMSRKGDKPFEWTGTGSPDDKDSPRAGSAARRARSSGSSW